MSLLTSQATVCRQYRDRGFCVRDIASMTGYLPRDIREALASDTSDRVELKAVATELLKRTPKGRERAEHVRIVKMNFADVI
jgi:hypothetical protein